MLWSAVGTKILATLLTAFGVGLITPISWGAIALVWGYALSWMFLADGVKLLTYRHLDLVAHHHRRFLSALQRSLHPYGSRTPRV